MMYCDKEIEQKQIIQKNISITSYRTIYNVGITYKQQKKQYKTVILCGAESIGE